MLGKPFLKIFKRTRDGSIIKRSPPTNRGTDNPVFEMEVPDLERGEKEVGHVIRAIGGE